jgi:quercetin dioxygenase-like cupin family protein
MKNILIIATAALLASLAWAQAARPSAPPGIKRTDVVRHDLGSGGLEVIQVRVDFAPGAAFGDHSHPGAEVAFILEGTLEYRFKGKPPVTFSAGESLFIPAGAIHSARNVGPGPAAELATYIVEKGKPLVVLSE